MTLGRLDDRVDLTLRLLTAAPVVEGEETKRDVPDSWARLHITAEGADDSVKTDQIQKKPRRDGKENTGQRNLETAGLVATPGVSDQSRKCTADKHVAHFRDEAKRPDKKK